MASRIEAEQIYETHYRFKYDGRLVGTIQSEHAGQLRRLWACDSACEGIKHPEHIRELIRAVKSGREPQAIAAIISKLGVSDDIG